MRIICVEGLSNSGKSSLCGELIKLNPSWIWINKIQKDDLVLKKLSEITHPIKNQGLFDGNTEALLYLSILSQKASLIEKFKNKNTVLLVDRFSLSVYAYLSIIIQRNAFLVDAIMFASRNIQPDLTILLDVSIDTILSRANNSPLSRKDLHIQEYYTHISDIFHDSLPKYSKESLIINSENQPVSDIANSIQRYLEQ